MAKMILDIWHGERGIDLAEWKRRHGLWGVIVKCGGSDDSYWNRFEETTFVEQATQAHELGLHVGAYYYSDALTAEDALADAEHCVNKCMRGVRLDMPIYLDIEEPAQLRLNMRQLTDVITTFCGRVRAAGYDAGVYAGYQVFNNVFMSELAGYSLWVASWQQSWPLWARDYDLWQEGSIDLAGNKYHRDGEVDGPGKIDLDWASDEFAARIEGGRRVTHKTIDPAEEAAEIHEFMCRDPRFGYNQQPCRWGGDHPAGKVTFTSKAGYTYELDTGSFDCSSSSIYAWRHALSRTKYAGCLDSATYTGDMRRVFVNSGLFTASLTNAKRGDLYLNEGVHVAMCQCGDADNDILSEFNRNENHAASYGQPGDQDGGESVIRGYYNDNWNTVLHYVGGLLEDVTAPQEEIPEEEKADMTALPLFVKLDGDPTEHLYIPSSGRLYAIANADEKKAVIDFFRLVYPGQTLDVKPVEFGSPDAPWGARLNDVLSRGANFRGFERFNKHPSLRATVTDIVRTELANADAIAQKVLDAIR